MIVKEKNPHAVALGKKGGLAGSAAQAAARRRNVTHAWPRRRENAAARRALVPGIPGPDKMSIDSAKAIQSA